MGTTNEENPEIEDKGCMQFGHVTREISATTGVTKESEEPCSSKSDNSHSIGFLS